MYDVLTKKHVFIPPVKAVRTNFGRESVKFIRENCTGLGFDASKNDLQDQDGTDGVPYNFERDIDRLCLENAIVRFLDTGSREDAFDIYFCYCEIFKPFGKGYDATRILLEMLSEHEENSSSLLMKHRDHYSHSVYVFLLGLAIYRNDGKIRAAYNEKYGLTEGAEACCHFLNYWGLSSLFHDIGYPFEIAHQQMKVYACSLMGLRGKAIDKAEGFYPFVSYKQMKEFAALHFAGNKTTEFDGNRIFARAIAERLGNIYDVQEEKLYNLLSDRAVNEQLKDERDKNKYLFMDHAYFSGLILLKKCCESKEMPSGDVLAEIETPMMDALTAIILHNSLFKFGIRGKMRGLQITDGQPLAYLLMLCDELQCWDRTSYGHNSRKGIYPFDFDLSFDSGTMIWNYSFDQANAKVLASEEMYQNMQYVSGNGKTGYTFADEIDKIVKLDAEITMNTPVIPKKKRTGTYLSDTNYLNLFDFALALNARYDQILTADHTKTDNEEIKTKMMKSFAKLSLEFKLSNIAQAKGFAKQLESINCFYTDRPVEYERLVDFSKVEIAKISEKEHIRWSDEKAAMGWSYGTEYLKAENVKQARALTRKHKDMVDFSELTEEDIAKDAEPMRMMIQLLKVFDGLNIYRMS